MRQKRIEPNWDKEKRRETKKRSESKSKDPVCPQAQVPKYAVNHQNAVHPLYVVKSSRRLLLVVVEAGYR